MAAVGHGKANQQSENQVEEHQVGRVRKKNVSPSSAIICTLARTDSQPAEVMIEALMRKSDRRASPTVPSRRARRVTYARFTSERAGTVSRTTPNSNPSCVVNPVPTRGGTRWGRAC